LSGVEIDGNSLMRFVYLDESGISSKETITVVAGVIIDADKQLLAVEAYLNDLIDEYVPNEHRKGFVFHATHLFHGSKVFDPLKYPMARRREVLKKLISIPARFSLPTVFGYSDKTALIELQRRHKRHPHRAVAVHQALTYSFCAIAAERYMRELARPEEVAVLTVENNDNARIAVKRIHNLLKYGGTGISYIEEIGKDYLPIRKIVHVPHFVLKDEVSLLQIADACAFIFRCYLEKKPNTEEFFDALTKNKPDRLAINPTPPGVGLDGYKILYFPHGEQQPLPVA
jgi:hypothetical protein